MTVLPLADPFEGERSRLLGLAYRITGSRAEAEDVVQDAWLAWDASDQVERPAAWLTTVTARLALDRLRSARHRREAYVGPWLPEPSVTTDDADGPEGHAELAESLTLGFLAVLEALQPIERVVLLLADAYDVPFAEIATTVGKTPEACRQIATRARRRVRAERPAIDPPAGARRVIEQLLVAVALGDLPALTALLAPDVVLLSDGGPTRHAARRPVVGPHRVSRFLANVAKRLGDAEVAAATVNGQPGLLAVDHGRVELVLEIEAVAGQAWRIHVVTAPEKLAHVLPR